MQPHQRDTSHFSKPVFLSRIPHRCQMSLTSSPRPSALETSWSKTLFPYPSCLYNIWNVKRHFRNIFQTEVIFWLITWIWVCHQTQGRASLKSTNQLTSPLSLGGCWCHDQKASLLEPRWDNSERSRTRTSPGKPRREDSSLGKLELQWIWLCLS